MLIEDLSVITQAEVINMYRHETEFIEFVWIFTVTVTQIKLETRELVEPY